MITAHGADRAGKAVRIAQNVLNLLDGLWIDELLRRGLDPTVVVDDLMGHPGNPSLRLRWSSPHARRGATIIEGLEGSRLDHFTSAIATRAGNVGVSFSCEG